MRRLTRPDPAFLIGFVCGALIARHVIFRAVDRALNDYPFVEICEPSFAERLRERDLQVVTIPAWIQSGN